MEDAWDATPDDGAVTVRSTLRAREQSATALLEAGSVASIGGNGKNTSFAPYGPGNLTSQQVASEVYRELIDVWDNGSTFLLWCAKYGFDAFVAERWNGIAASLVAIPPPLIIIDTTGRWADLCTQFSVDSTKVIGAPVSDGAMFLWTMDHLVAIRQAASDYSGLLTRGGGMQWV